MFINVEGIDGSGKTTLINYLKTEFTDMHFTKEPTDSFEFDKLKKLDNKYDSIYNFFLFTYDRIKHQEEIKKNLDKIVISDRYLISSIAYEGPLIDQFFNNMDETINYILNASKMVILPDIIIYLDADVDISINRIINNRKSLNKNNKILSILEEKDNLKNVKMYYNYFFDNLKKFTDKDIRIIKIDANRNINEIFNDAHKVIKDIISNL